jgi:hypothetical protein
MSYTRCSFKSVLDLVVSYAGQTSAQLDATQLLQLNGYINSRLRDWAWIGWPWPEITLVEKRRYRQDYAAATAYAAPTATSASEIYFPPAQQYFQALKATTGNAPATLTGGTWIVNAAYWAACSGPYTGPDWTDATAYTVGAIVRDPADGLFKQCHTAHTSSGTLDATKFGILTVFDPYIARAQSWAATTIGDFIGIFLDNPKLERRPRRIIYYVDGTGAHMETTPYSRYGRGLGCDYLVPHEVYVKFRLPPPDFKGAAYSGSATYTGGTDWIYYAGGTTDLEGDYWACVTSTSAGESPATAAAKWARLEFPAWLRTPVARRAFADWLRYSGNREAAFAEDQAADDALFQEQLKQGSQQAQVLRWRQNG